MPPLQNGSPTVATKHAERAHTNTLTREKKHAPSSRPRARPRAHARASSSAVDVVRWRFVDVVGSNHTVYTYKQLRPVNKTTNTRSTIAPPPPKKSAFFDRDDTRRRRPTPTQAGRTTTDTQRSFVRLFPRRSPRRVSREDKGRATTKDRYSAPETARRCCRWRTTHER